MRDPKRIDDILNIIKRIWIKHPNLRLCQMILNITKGSIEEQGYSDLYNLEDDQLIIRLEELYHEKTG